MNKDEFHALLRQYLHRQPFAPFVVKLRDGRRLAIKQPRLIFCDGSASFIDPDEEALVEFSHAEVLDFGLLEQEIPA